jgi:tRNA threonylcarbamoyl adenosine modification protein (Sua5/YciO/YrdC/YwlC family)
MTRVVAAAAPQALAEAVAALRRGDVIAIPTETVYGVAVLPTEHGIERLIATKHRSAEKGIQLLVDSVDQVAEIAELTTDARRLADAFWPGGLTIVLSRNRGVDLPESIGGGRSTLGIRLPDHDVPRAIARELGPIAASSANISGEPPATDATMVACYFGDELALILDDGPVRGGTSSTVVDCSDPAAEPVVLREGAITSDQLAAALSRG